MYLDGKSETARNAIELEPKVVGGGGRERGEFWGEEGLERGEFWEMSVPREKHNLCASRMPHCREKVF